MLSASVLVDADGEEEVGVLGAAMSQGQSRGFARLLGDATWAK
jgi:hypothetical protein